MFALSFSMQSNPKLPKQAQAKGSNLLRFFLFCHKFIVVNFQYIYESKIQNTSNCERTKNKVFKVTFPQNQYINIRIRCQFDKYISFPFCLIFRLSLSRIK